MSEADKTKNQNLAKALLAGDCPSVICPCGPQNTSPARGDELPAEPAAFGCSPEDKNEAYFVGKWSRYLGCETGGMSTFLVLNEDKTGTMTNRTKRRLGGIMKLLNRSKMEGTWKLEEKDLVFIANDHDGKETRWGLRIEDEYSSGRYDFRRCTD